MESTGLDPAIIFLHSAKEYDVTALARCTHKTLGIILPWCQLQETSSIISLTKAVHNQAIQYAQAVDLSVTAAHNGFTVAEDALSLLELLQTIETTAEERHDFLQGTLKLARRGRKNALEAKNRFIDVRNVVEGLARRLIEDEEGKASLKYEELVDGKLVSVSMPLSDVASQLLQGIQYLEEFRDSLTQFSAWWNLIEMETRTQIDREQQLVDRPMDKIRMRTVASRWNNHRIQYASYVNEIGLIQDHYPALFTESRNTIRNHTDNTFSQAFVTPLIDPNLPSYASFTSDPLPFTSKDAFGIPHVARSESYNNTSSLPQIKQHKPRAESNVIISEEFDALSSYLSASLKHVQILDPGRRAFLMLHFVCHTDNAHRCCSIKIKWRFRSVNKSSNPPQVVDVAPKQSVGAHTDEAHKRNLGVNAPVQVNVCGATVGPELVGNWERNKVVSRAMIITGSVRGLWSDSAEWTVVENSGAKAGVPTHFCVGVIVDYDGPFKMELMLDAKHVATAKWWKSRVQARNEYPLDIDARATEFDPYNDTAGYKDWFYSINGEIDGTGHVYKQLALRRE